MAKPALVTDEEFKRFQELIENRCKVLSTAVARLYYVKNNSWEFSDTGIISLTKDSERRNYFIQLFNMDNFVKTQEFEILYNSFYEIKQTQIHTCSNGKCNALLSFSDRMESEKFANEIKNVIQIRKVQKEKKRQSQINYSIDVKVPYNNVIPITNEPRHSVTKVEAKPSKTKKNTDAKSSQGAKKITKNDISIPMNFQHLDHMGLNDHFFTNTDDLENFKKFLRSTKMQQLVDDKNSVDAIYDFVDKYGGLSKLENELRQKEMKDRKTSSIPTKDLPICPPKQPPSPNRPPANICADPLTPCNNSSDTVIGAPLPHSPATVAPLLRTKSMPANKHVPVAEEPRKGFLSEILKFNTKKYKDNMIENDAAVELFDVAPPPTESPPPIKHRLSKVSETDKAKLQSKTIDLGNVSRMKEYLQKYESVIYQTKNPPQVQLHTPQLIRRNTTKIHSEIIEQVDALDGPRLINRNFKRSFADDLEKKLHNANIRQVLTNKLKRNSENIELSKNEFMEILMDRTFQYTDKLLERSSKDILSENISKEIIEQAIASNKIKLLTSLFHKANVDVQNKVFEDILFCYALNANEIDFETLQNHNLVSAKIFENGESLLTNLIKSNKPKFVWKLLSSNNCNLYINLKNSKLQSPLQVAIEMNSLDIANFFIYESSQLNDEDENGMTALEQIFQKMNDSTDKSLKNRMMSVAKSIVNIGGDIYKLTSRGRLLIDIYRNSWFGNEIENYYKNKGRIRNSQESDIKICSICRDKEIDCVYDCGHTFCMTCGETMYCCPVCRSEPTNPRKIFL